MSAEDYIDFEDFNDPQQDDMKHSLTLHEEYMQYLASCRAQTPRRRPKTFREWTRTNSASGHLA